MEIQEYQTFVEIRVSSLLSFEVIRSKVTEKLKIGLRSIVVFPGSDFNIKGKIIILFKEDITLIPQQSLITGLEEIFPNRS